MSLWLSAAASAQTAVQRSLPPLPPPNEGPIAQPDLVPASEDDRPFGVDLHAVVLLDSDDAPLAMSAHVPAAVDASRVPNLDRRETRLALYPFIGRPISRKLIAQVEAEIARQARRTGRPFVSLSTPEQELTRGILQIRVTEFEAGDISVQGDEGEVDKTIRKGIRLRTGEPVSSRQLAEDIDWLNRDPFSQVSAHFTPATGEAGVTDLKLAVRRDRPGRVYAGWTNDGSSSTGTDRFYIGAMARPPLLARAYVSYQLTGSSDFWYEDEGFLRPEPRYVAQGLRAYAVPAPRQSVELTVSDALTNQDVNADFSVRQRTTEVTLGYRSAVSNLGFAAGSGDLLLGVEFKQQNREVFFGELTALDDVADIWQGVLGVSKGWLGNGQRVAGSVNLHFAPGGVNERSSAERLEAITNGRMTSDQYTYATFDLSGAFRLPADFALSEQVSVQLAEDPLPLPAQIGLGGAALARGYTADDGSFDSGLLVRNEMRLPTFALLKGREDNMAPFVFVDVAHGRDLAQDTRSTLASAGFGTDYRIGRNISAGLNSAWALKNGGDTEAGDWRVQARFTVSY